MQEWHKFRPFRMLLLGVLLATLFGCGGLPRILNISAPPDGTEVHVGQTVRVSVHVLNPQVPPVTGVVRVTGPSTAELPLEFTEPSEGYFVARVEWVPTQPGEYRLTAEGELQNGERVGSRSAVTVRVLGEQALRQIPTLRFQGKPITPAPVEQASPTAVPTTLTPTSGPVTPSPTPLPCLMAGFVADVTIPDDTVLQPGQSFVKTWRLRNEGSCTWTTAFGVVFKDGDRMDAPDFTPLPHPVAPQQTVDVSVPMRAPLQPGTYQANFLLRSADGTLFGLSEEAKPFYVRIRVPAPTGTPTPTARPTPRVDLTVTQVTLQPQDPKPGQSMLVTVIVANLGPDPAGRFTTHWWREEGGPITCGWTLDNGLAPGQSQTFQCAFAAPDTVGRKTGLVGVDLPRNDIPETNENNNVQRVSYQVVPADTTGPTIKASRSSDLITWPPQCPSTRSVTITASVHDPSGVAWVQLKYRVVQGRRVGQWVTKPFTLVGTDRYQVELSSNELVNSLNPPLQGSTPGAVEYIIIAADTLGNQSQSQQPNLRLEYCIY